MKVVPRILVFFIVACVFFVPVYSQDKDFSLGLGGVRFLYALIPTGLDVTASYTGLSLIDDVDTILFAKLGGGYQDKRLLRDTVSGDPTMVADAFPSYDMVNFQWELAFIQGIVPGEKKNLLEAFAYYRGRADAMAEGQAVTVFPDLNGLVGTSFMAGLTFDTTEKDAHEFYRGAMAEVSAEWGPGVLNPVGGMDFVRLDAQAKGYLPVFDLPSEKGNKLNGYFAAFASADWATGASVPIYVNQSFGGRNLRGSLGDCVRGYGWLAYDTSLKAVANLEFRLVGPSLFLDPLLPILYVFADAGYYSGFDGSTNQAAASDLLASTGGGIAVNLFGFAQLGYRVDYKIISDRVYEQKSLTSDIRFFLHF